MTKNLLALLASLGEFGMFVCGVEDVPQPPAEPTETPTRGHIFLDDAEYQTLVDSQLATRREN